MRSLEQCARSTAMGFLIPLRASSGISVTRNPRPAKCGLLLCCLLAAAAANAQSHEAKMNPVATVDGTQIYEEDLLPAIQPQLLPLRSQEYDIKKKALDDFIQQKLLEGAAKKKGVTTELLLVQEVDAKIGEPS